MQRAAICFLFLAHAATANALQIAPLPLPIDGHDAQPSIVADRKGYILTWQRKNQAGNSLHYAELDQHGRLRRDGLVATSTPASPWFINWADFPALSVLDNGDWVAWWLQKRSADIYAYDIHLTRSTDRGRHWQTSLLPHRDGTASEHGFVSLLPAGKDRVLAIWLDGRNTAASAGDGHAHGDHHGAMTLRSAVIDRRGRLNEESEIDARTCDCCNTDAARIGNESLIVYRDRSEDEIRDIAFSRRQRSGDWTSPAIVHNDQWKISGCPVNGPALAAHNGRALAAWTTMHDDTLSVRAAIGDRDGFAAAMIELEHGEKTLGHVDVTTWQDDQFLLTWVGADQHAQTNAILLALVDANGQLLSRHTITTLPAGSNPGMPRIARSDNSAIVVWTSIAENAKPILRAALIQPDQ